MFRIIKDGVSVGMTETPNYIKQQENGCFALCPEPEASGIVFEGTVYRLLESGSIDDVTAAEHAELFAPWNFPVAYQKGNMRQYKGTLYKCVQDHTSQEDWTPDTASSLWTAAADPSEEWPKWAQPIGAHDVYNAGDKVSHNEKHWISNQDGNVWEPGAYGWTEVMEDGV